MYPLCATTRAPLAPAYARTTPPTPAALECATAAIWTRPSRPYDLRPCYDPGLLLSPSRNVPTDVASADAALLADGLHAIQRHAYHATIHDRQLRHAHASRSNLHRGIAQHAISWATPAAIHPPARQRNRTGRVAFSRRRIPRHVERFGTLSSLGRPNQLTLLRQQAFRRSSPFATQAPIATQP